MAAFVSMKSAGIRTLKDQLSKYIKLVQRGEVVYVTDHDEIVAELRRPTSVPSSTFSPFEQRLLDLVNVGQAIPCTTSSSVFPKCIEDLGSPPEPVDLSELLLNLSDPESDTQRVGRV